jgi:hypothetical protein
MQQNSEELTGTQQPSLTTVLMMGGWMVHVIPGIVYGIKANCGELAAYPLIGQWSLSKEAS